MTRANINFRYLDRTKAQDKTIYRYHNGDQYPSGLVRFFNVLELLEGKETISKEDFNNWLLKNYPNDKTTKIINSPHIYYDKWGGIADYSYVFEEEGRILVYEWNKLIFEGNIKEAVQWFKKQ